MMHSLDIFEEKRPWGSFRRFTLNMPSTVKIIKVNPNEVLSLQSHKNRKEFWKVIKGEGVFEIGDTIYNVKEGDEFEVPKETKHRIASQNQYLEVLEIAVGDFDENDIIRYEDKYGRVNG